MLNLDTNQMFLIPGPISPICHIVDYHQDANKDIYICMSYLTEEEEQELEDFQGDVFKLQRGNRTFEITRNQIYCYGHVDFNSKRDCQQIRKFNFLNYLGSVGHHCFSNYDYKTHCFKSPKRYALWTETWDPLYLCKIAHGALSKPERIILFKQVYGSVQKKRSR